MKNSKRNSYVINHSLRVYLVAAILSSIVGQLNATVDGIIVSNTVDADAISAVTLSWPILNFFSLFGTVVFAGAQLLMVAALGDQKYQQVNRIFTVSITSVLVVNGLLALVLSVFADSISLMLTSEERLFPLISDYLSIASFGCVGILMVLNLGIFVENSGHPRIVTKAMVVLFLANFLFDLLLVVGFRLGMKGAALALVLSSLAAILTYVPYLMKAPRPFHLDLPSFTDTLRLGVRCARRGMFAAVSLACFMLLIFGLNAIILHTQGSDGMFILSVCMQILSIGMLVQGGARTAIRGIGGMLYGELDWDGMNRLFNSIFKIMIAWPALVTILLFSFPSLLSRLYGADDALIAVSIQPLRQFCLTLIPFAVVLFQVNIFLVTNRDMLAIGIQMGSLVYMLILFGAFSYWFPSQIWIAFPLGMWLLMVVCLTFSYVVSKRDIGIHRIYLTSTISNLDSYTVSVKYEFDEVNDKLHDLLFYSSIFDLDEKRMKVIEHCLEEIMFHQYEMGVKEGKKGTFDVSVVDQPERFTIIVKAVGKAYNPLVSFRPVQLDDVDDGQLYMLMVQSICDEVRYKYFDGLNCLYINIKKENL